MTSRPPVLRAPRALMAGATCAVGATAAHVGAGGALPGPATMVVLVAVTVAGSGLLAGRRLTVSSLLALALLAQGGLHLAHLVTAAPGTGAGDGSLMLVTHVLAAVATTALAALGEDAVWRVLDRLGLRLLVLPSAPRTCSSARPAPLLVSREVVPPAEWQCPVRPRRGPPARPVHPALSA